MPPKKSKMMSPRINKTPTLKPSRRSPRVPAPQKSTDESSQPSKPVNIKPASPQDTSILRFFSSKPSPTSPKSPENPPETPSSRRRTFQSRPSRLSTVYTPVVETPATSSSSRRTRRTAALETPKNEGSDNDLPDSIGGTGWTYDQYMGTLESEGTADGPSSPTSVSDMRNSSRVRKPTMRAIESLETTTKKPRRKNTAIPSPTVEKPDPLSTKVAKNNVKKTNVLKKPVVKTRTSKRMANSNKQKNFVLLGYDIDTEAVGKALFEITCEALNSGFTLPSNYPDFYNKTRDEYYQRQQDEKYGTDVPTDAAGASDDVEMADEDLTAIPDIVPLPSPTPAAVPAKDAGILGYEKQSDPKINDDGWVETGRINTQGEEVTLIPDQYHPYYLSHTYGYEGLPFPPVRARSSQQAETDYSHGFPPVMGGRNLPSDGVSPFITENVKEEQARVLANAPAPAPPTTGRKPRARKRRQTATVGTTDTKTDDTSSTTPTAADGARKSQRRRRQTAPAPSILSTSLSSPPKTETKVRSSGPAAAVTTAATEDDKPKVQRLRLTLKPEHKAETPAKTSTSAAAPAKGLPSSPAPSHAPTPASTSKRRRRRG